MADDSPFDPEKLFDISDLPEDMQRIIREQMAMTDEEVQEYLVEHGLEYLVTPERVDKALRDAMAVVEARRRKLN
ncbi:MAG: hypothetical protein AAB921_02490 [Patescibacteria group bacterium]